MVSLLGDDAPFFLVGLVVIVGLSVFFYPRFWLRPVEGLVAYGHHDCVLAIAGARWLPQRLEYRAYRAGQIDMADERT